MNQAAAPSDGEIVVTAQFRQESAQKAAVSIDVLSAETLARAGVAQATDLARLSPGVQITQGGSSLQIYIRGAGDFSTAVTIAPLTPLFIHNTGNKFKTDRIEAIYKAFGKAESFKSQTTKIGDSELAAWLSSK